MDAAEKIVILQRVEKDLKLIIAFDDTGDTKLVDETLKYLRVTRGRAAALAKPPVKADGKKIVGK